MPSIEEISRDSWKVLSTLPVDFLDSLIGTLQHLDEETLPQFQLAMSTFSEQDLKKLQGASGASVSEIYQDSVYAADENDGVYCIKRYLMETPIIISEIIDGVTYTIKTNAAGMQRGFEMNSTLVRYSLPCDVAMEYLGQSITVPITYESSMGITRPQDIKSSVKRIISKIKKEILLLPKHSFDRSAIDHYAFMTWQRVYPDVIYLLWDHPQIGDVLKNDANTQNPWYFVQFRDISLDFVTMYVEMNKDFTQTMAEEDSIAFIFQDQNFMVFTRTNEHYIRDGWHDLGKISQTSNLYKKLELVNTLANS